MIEVDEFSTTVHVRDGDMLFSARQREYIREQALAVLLDYFDHHQRVQSEQRITSGVRDEQEGEA
jgi:hypothetical protein